jgi:hypothetical protein
MKIQTKTLLAGVAALALVAGTGFASAQEQKPAKQPQTSVQSMRGGAAPSAQPQAGASHMSQQQQGASHAGRQPSASHTGQQLGQNAQPGGHRMGMEQPAQRGKSTAQQQTKGTERFGQSQTGVTTHGRQAEQINRGNKGNFERRGTAQTEQKGNFERRGTAQTEQKGNVTRGGRTGGTTLTEQRTGRNGLHGLQGNASHVTLSDQQRTKIRQTVIGASGAPRVSSVDFDLAVGTVVPRGHIQVVPVPRMLVDIEPAWRGFLYFIYQDELVIVDPNDMRIVAVVPV